MIRLRAGNKEFEVRNATWPEIVGAVAVLVVLAAILRTIL